MIAPFMTVNAANRTVYVVQEDKGKNVLPAMDFGHLVPLLQLDDEMSLLNVPRIVEKLKYGLRDFRPGDYILPIGNPASIGIACAIAASMTGGLFNVLKWDQQERRYFPLQVNLNQSGR